MRPLLAAMGLATALLAIGASAASSQEPDPIGDLHVTVAPTKAEAVLGETLELTVTIANTGGSDGDGLVVHLDITDPSRASSVDPEDWTATLSRPLDAVAPGDTAMLTWEVQPISAGQFSLYGVVLRPGSDELAASNVVTIAVDDRRSLNPDGILPVALGAPIVVGGLLMVQIGYRRRTWRDG